MPVVISGTNGVSGVDGTASNPSYEGTDSNTGIFFPAADTIAFAEGGTEVMRIDSSGNVGIGTSSPLARFQSSPTSGINTVAALLTTGSPDPDFRAGFANGSGNTLGSEQAKIGLFYFNAVTPVCHIGLLRGGSANSDGMTFNVNNIERARIDNSGNLLVTNAAGLGYGTGAGGTVTQATNKSTTVTLNRPTGQITMNNAALAANTAVAFSVLNSLVAAADVILLTGTNSPNTTNYRIEPFNVAAGVFGIRLTNISGGSLSEAVVINFAIIKGATS
jgi:hypothetical protein